MSNDIRLLSIEEIKAYPLDENNVYLVELDQYTGQVYPGSWEVWKDGHRFITGNEGIMKFGPATEYSDEVVAEWKRRSGEQRPEVMDGDIIFVWSRDGSARTAYQKHGQFWTGFNGVIPDATVKAWASEGMVSLEIHDGQPTRDWSETKRWESL